MPDEGSVPFFALLALATAGYFVTLRQVANGLRPSGRALLACAALALAWRIPLLLAPPERDADVRRYVWDAHLVRAGQSPWTVVPADPAFAHLRTEAYPLYAQPHYPRATHDMTYDGNVRRIDAAKARLK